jgi:hypothetical protein
MISTFTMDDAQTFAYDLVANGWRNPDPDWLDVLHRQLAATLAARTANAMFPVRAVDLTRWLSTGICTCPSGDGSLRWPCPAHPPVAIPLDQLRPLNQSAFDVISERQRQVDTMGYDFEHDDAHPCGEIAAYAAFYAMPPAAREWPATETGYGATFGEAIIPADWTMPQTGDRRRELVKAGALILAEIDRLDRAAEQHAVKPAGA